MESAYRAERTTEVTVLRDPRVRAVLPEDRVRLMSFYELIDQHGPGLR